MKLLRFSVAIIISTFFCCNRTTAQNLTGPVISFQYSTYNFENATYGSDGICSFPFTNSGADTLIISSVKGSGNPVECSLYVIPPGSSGTIKVKFDSKRTGYTQKSATVSSNAVNEPVLVLRICGYVLPPAEEKGSASGEPTFEN